DRALELENFGFGDAPHTFVVHARRRRELAAEVEKLVLQPLQELYQPRRSLRPCLRRQRAYDTEHGVELVDRAVGHDPLGILGDTSAADERGLAPISPPRVDLGDPDRHQRGFLRSSYARPAGLPLSTGRPESRQPRAAGEPPKP